MTDYAVINNQKNGSLFVRLRLLRLGLGLLIDLRLLLLLLLILVLLLLLLHLPQLFQKLLWRLNSLLRLLLALLLFVIDLLLRLRIALVGRLVGWRSLLVSIIVRLDRLSDCTARIRRALRRQRGAARCRLRSRFRPQDHSLYRIRLVLGT